MPDMLHVVNFSGGLCSFWAAHRVAEKCGTEHMVLLFADTLIEDEGLYVFNERAAELLGVPITPVGIGLEPWELFMREGLIGNNRFPICSTKLKREPLNEWIAKNCLDRSVESQETLFGETRRPCVVYVGFDWSEGHRLIDLRRELSGYRIEAPMADEPIWDKCRMEREARALGLPIPKLYSLGFPHNNCGGRCVRAGISHFVHLYRVLPDRFADWMLKEQAARENFLTRGIEPLSVLKDRRGGQTRSLWLSDLKARIESGEKFPNDEWGGCGCGGATQDQYDPLRAIGGA